MANKRVLRSLNKVAQILTARPKMVGQVSTETLGSVPLSSDPTGQLGITVKKELGKRSATGEYGFRTKRKK